MRPNLNGARVHDSYKNESVVVRANPSQALQAASGRRARRAIKADLGSNLPCQSLASVRGIIGAHVRRWLSAAADGLKRSLQRS